MVEFGFELRSEWFQSPGFPLYMTLLHPRSISEKLTKNDILSFDDILLLPTAKRGVHHKTPRLGFKLLGITAEVTPQRRIHDI